MRFIAAIASVAFLMCFGVVSSHAVKWGNGAYKNVFPLPNSKHDAADVNLGLTCARIEVIVGLDPDKNGMEDAAIRFAGAARTPERAIAPQTLAVEDALTKPARKTATGSAATTAEGAEVNNNGVVRFGPLNGPGPLGESVASTFKDGSYTQMVLDEETILYRAYGGEAGPLGSYWTRIPPAGPLLSTIDLALDPSWGNTARRVSVIKVPAGTTIYKGYAAPQGELVGGGSQVYIPKVDPAWLISR